MTCNRCQYWNIPSDEKETMLCTNKRSVYCGFPRRCFMDACSKFIELGKEREHDREEENHRPD